MSSPTMQQMEAALYRDDSGEVVGLDEVQLLENPSPDRVAILHAALRSQDLELQYRAALVLAAWGDDQGLDDIEHLIDMRIDTEGVVVPHRIYGYNNIYDEFARAVYLFGHSGRQITKQKRIYAKLLALYGPCDYQGKLKNALLETEFRELLPDVEQACRRALRLGKHYLASQLLPVIAKWDSDEAWQFIGAFDTNTIETPNPVANVAQALRYIDSFDARSLLQELCKHPDVVVSDEAKKALSKLK